MINNVPRYVAFGVIVPAAGLLLLFSTSFGGPRRVREPASPAAASPAETEIAELRRELREVEKRQSQVATTLQAKGPTPAAAPAFALASRPDPEEANRHADETAVAQLDLLEKSFARESRDFAWSESAAHRLSSAFPRGPAKLDDVECAATMCRATIVADQQKDVETAFRKLMASLPWNGQGFGHSTGEGAPVAKFYLMREGEKLPLADGMRAEL